MEKPEKTLGDYLAIAVSPLLIMLMVGSLSWFAMDVLYDGNYKDRLRWTLFWFVIASVLISRVSIEHGRLQGWIYGFALAGATTLVFVRFANEILLPLILLAAIWWCIMKLTWDCTFIDENEDSSGEGLMDAADTTSDRRSPPWRENVRNKLTQFWNKATLSSRETKKPHSHGSWIIYFSLIALPTFGVGHAMNHSAGQNSSFKYILIYCLATLGLLLCTSFLNLRRYLRQRSLTMPLTTASVWILTGTIITFTVLGLSLLFPRPNTHAIPFHITETATRIIKEADKLAVLSSDSREGQGKRTGEPGEERNMNTSRERNDSGSGKSLSHSTPAKEGNDYSSAEDGRNVQEGHQAGKTSPGGGSTIHEQINESENSDKRPHGQESEVSDIKTEGVSDTKMPDVSIPGWSWIALILILLMVFLKPVAAMIQKLISTLLHLFQRNPKTKNEDGQTTIPSPEPVKPFSQFSNPFSSDKNLTPAELITYTFEGLQAWAWERGSSRRNHETPMEFVHQIEKKYPEMNLELRTLSLSYCQLAYASKTAFSDQVRERLNSLWKFLESESPDKNPHP